MKSKKIVYQKMQIHNNEFYLLDFMKVFHFLNEKKLNDNQNLSR